VNWAIASGKVEAESLFVTLKWISMSLTLFFGVRKFIRFIRRKLRNMKKPTA